MNVKKVTASSNGVLSGIYKIVGVRLVAGSDAATAILYDNASAQSGDEVIKLSVASANGTDKDNWQERVAPQTTNGISVTLTGTSSVLYIYYI